ncbi:MAG TPA: hypothetical protein VK116_00965, partial [Planctomycetota bacterium]|nr:hypothetical protein [Planctomycetota bacterium]
ASSTRDGAERDRSSRPASAIPDLLALLFFNFSGGPEPPCLAARDANGDGLVLGAVTDAVHILAYGILSGSPPAPPFPECGPLERPEDREIGCERAPPSCQ